MNRFLWGVSFGLFWAAGLFFLRFWKKTGDRLFGLFGFALWILAIERLLLLLVSESNEIHPYIYLARLVAFAIILAGIIDKNRRKT